MLTSFFVNSRYVIVQSTKGALLGLGVGLAGVWAAGKRWPAFRQMPLPFKAFLVTGATAGVGVTVADRASLKFERDRYGYGPSGEKAILPHDSDWKHKTALWMSKNRWTLIAGTWAGTMAGSWYIINKNKYMTVAQKGVQARMIAQGITVILLLVSASLATRRSDEAKIEFADPRDPTKTFLVEEKYPGESQWMSQVAAAEDQMRAEGKIDKEGHLITKNQKKNGSSKKAKEQER